MAGILFTRPDDHFATALKGQYLLRARAWHRGLRLRLRQSLALPLMVLAAWVIWWFRPVAENDDRFVLCGLIGIFGTMPCRIRAANSS